MPPSGIQRTQEANLRGRRTLALLCAALVVGAAPASAQNDDLDPVYQRYALIRDDLISCYAQEVFGSFTKRQQRACRRLKRRYTLFAYPGTSGEYFIHCRTSRRCPATPGGLIPANGPIPAGSTVYR